jgi:hypothetical protein
MALSVGDENPGLRFTLMHADKGGSEFVLPVGLDRLRPPVRPWFAPGSPPGSVCLSYPASSFVCFEKWVRIRIFLFPAFPPSAQGGLVSGHRDSTVAPNFRGWEIVDFGVKSFDFQAGKFLKILVNGRDAPMKRDDHLLRNWPFFRWKGMDSAEPHFIGVVFGRCF